jgi:hypothetical protein
MVARDQQAQVEVQDLLGQQVLPAQQDQLAHLVDKVQLALLDQLDPLVFHLQQEQH